MCRAGIVPKIPSDPAPSSQSQHCPLFPRSLCRHPATTRQLCHVAHQFFRGSVGAAEGGGPGDDGCRQGQQTGTADGGGQNKVPGTTDHQGRRLTGQSNTTTNSSRDPSFLSLSSPTQSVRIFLFPIIFSHHISILLSQGIPKQERILIFETSGQDHKRKFSKRNVLSMFLSIPERKMGSLTYSWYYII